MPRQFYMAIIFIFGSSAILTVLPDGAAPVFFHSIGTAIIGLTLTALCVTLLLIICRTLFLR